MPRARVGPGVGQCVVASWLRLFHGITQSPSPGLSLLSCEMQTIAWIALGCFEDQVQRDRSNPSTVPGTWHTCSGCRWHPHDCCWYPPPPLSATPGNRAPQSPWGQLGTALQAVSGPGLSLLGAHLRRGLPPDTLQLPRTLLSVRCARHPCAPPVHTLVGCCEDKRASTAWPWPQQLSTALHELDSTVRLPPPPGSTTSGGAMRRQH